MTKKLFIPIFLLLFSAVCWSQEMSTTTYRDLSIPFIEQDVSKYDFAYPINSNVLDSVNFTPPTDGVYSKSTFGHRYLSGTPNKTDNHGGFDYWSEHSYNGIDYDDSTKVPIICMCDGTITQVLNGPDSLLELTGTGRSVRVTCDSLSQAFGGVTSIYYRHLSSLGPLPSVADTAVSGSISISKGEVIGLMGESGTTTNVHLHLSSTSVHPFHGNSFLSTARLFDPTLHPGILKELTDAKLEILHDWSDSALVRVIWPLNQTINRFEFINQSDTIVFDKEEAYQTGAAVRDNHDCLPGVRVFAYQFNGKQTAQSRYLSEMNNMPANYPASPQRDTNIAIYGYSHVPIAYDSIAYVYDFMLEDLSPSHQTEDFVIKLSDVWGYTVEGTFPTNSIDQEIQNTAPSVYPNPTYGEFTIVFEQDGLKIMRLYDVFGRLMLQRDCDLVSDSIDIGHFPKGIYLLSVESQNGISTVKIVKE